MADPSSVVSFGEIIEKAGITVATLCGLVWCLRWLSQVHLAALNQRIATLEGVVEKRDAELLAAYTKIGLLQESITKRADDHAAEMREMALKLAGELRENRQFNREQHNVLVRFLDRLEQQLGMLKEGDKHKSSAELPAPPSDPSTDRHMRHA